MTFKEKIDIVLGFLTVPVTAFFLAGAVMILIISCLGIWVRILEKENFVSKIYCQSYLYDEQ